MDCARYSRKQLHRAPWRIAKAFLCVEQTSAGGEFHAEKGKTVVSRADVVNGQNIWMIEAGGGPGFTLKPHQGLAGIAVIIQHPFQRHDSSRGRVPGAINDPHAAATDFFQNTIVAQLPVAVGNIDCGEKRVEVLDVRFLRIKAAAQQTTYAEPRSDACE